MCSLPPPSHQITCHPPKYVHNNAGWGPVITIITMNANVHNVHEDLNKYIFIL
jgi:hypothetical protein